jgi:hypothetical protein
MFDLWLHCCTDHADKLTRVEGVRCPSPECDWMTPFASDEIYQEHLRACHKGMMIPDTKNITNGYQH